MVRDSKESGLVSNVKVRCGGPIMGAVIPELGTSRCGAAPVRYVWAVAGCGFVVSASVRNGTVRAFGPVRWSTAGNGERCSGKA